MFGSAIVDITKPLNEIVTLLKEILKALLNLQLEIKSLKMKM